MSVKLTVNMTVSSMYDFMLHHTYSGVRGLSGAVFGVVMLGLGIGMWMKETYLLAVTMLLMSVLFLLVVPATLKGKAKKQVEDTPLFQRRIFYEIDEEGIKLSQGKSKTFKKWDELQKAISTNQSIVVYISNVQAFIFPRKDLGEQYTAVVQHISTHMPPDKVKLKTVR